MKFINKRTGVILEPASAAVADQLRKIPEYGVCGGRAAAQGEVKPLSKMNKEELLKAAQDAEIEVPNGAGKAEIIDLIKAAEG